MLLLATHNETLVHHHQQRCKSKGGTTWEDERDQWEGSRKDTRCEYDQNTIYTRIKMS